MYMHENARHTKGGYEKMVSQILALIIFLCYLVLWTHYSGSDIWSMYAQPVCDSGNIESAEYFYS